MVCNDDFQNDLSGKTRCDNYLSTYSPEYLTGLIGSDTEKSLSPRIHNKMYEKLDISAIYKAFSISADKFSKAFEAVANLAFRGINITYPFKREAVNLVNNVEDRAEKIGAINTVKFENDVARGYNTDYLAIRQLMQKWFAKVNFRLEFLLVGGGGAARATAAAIDSLESFPVRKVFIANRTREKAESISDELLNSDKVTGKVVQWRENEVGEVVQQVDMIIDATTLGWKRKLFPGADKITSRNKVFDLSYSEKPSPLLNLADRRGCQTENGLRMLLLQAQEAHNIWFGKTKFSENILPADRYITIN